MTAHVTLNVFGMVTARIKQMDEMAVRITALEVIWKFFV